MRMWCATGHGSSPPLRPVLHLLSCLHHPWEDVQVTQFGFHLRVEKMLHFLLLFLSFALSISARSQAHSSIEDQIPEDSSVVTYLTKLPTVWFNVWKFLDQPKNSPRSTKIHSPTKRQLTFRRRKGPRKESEKKHRSDVLQEKQFVLVPPPPPVGAGRFPIFFRRRPQSIFTRLALGAQVFYGNLAFLGEWSDTLSLLQRKLGVKCHKFPKKILFSYRPFSSHRSGCRSSVASKQETNIWTGGKLWRTQHYDHFK